MLDVFSPKITKRERDREREREREREKIEGENTLKILGMYSTLTVHTYFGKKWIGLNITFLLCPILYYVLFYQI